MADRPRDQTDPEFKIRVSKTRATEQKTGSSEPTRPETAEQLMVRLKQAQEIGDEAAVHRHLRQLEKLQGRESIFLLKSQAFQYISQGSYAQADALLNRVLAVKPSDVEAGLQLALVEFNTDRPQEAKARIELLAQDNPTDPRPRQLLKQLFP